MPPVLKTSCFLRDDEQEEGGGRKEEDEADEEEGNVEVRMSNLVI